MFLVTGATGNVGSQLVDQLLTAGQPVRVFVRDPARVARWGDRIEVATGSFENPESFARAAAGTEAVFLMNLAQTPAVFTRLLDAIQPSGPARIVFLSTLLASRPGFQLGRLHLEKENAIRSSGLPRHILRPGGFMSNTRQWAGTIRADGVVYNPMASGKSAPIAPEDIAAVAARLLVSPDHAEEILELTGSELLTVPEQVETLAKILDKPIRCVDVPVEAAVEGMVRNGLPAQVAAAVAESLKAVRDGNGVQITDTVQRVTGHRPITFAEWAQGHASQFA